MSNSHWAKEDRDGEVKVKPPTKRRPWKQQKPRPKNYVENLPPWKVLLHNDPKNAMDDVVNAVMEIVKLKKKDAKEKVKYAHEHEVALLVITHKERAELYKDQFKSYEGKLVQALTVTIEPAE